MTLNQPSRPRGLTGNAIRTWGYLFLLLGIVGQSILQNQLLGLNHLTTDGILNVLNANPSNMGIATAALVFRAIETCAAPLYTFLLVEGFCHTSNARNYLLRILGTAVVSEIPYNLVMSEKWIDFSGRNPVFGMALCLFMLMLYQRIKGTGVKNAAIKVGITLLTMVWMKMLGIRDGMCFVVLTVAFWCIRNKPNFRTLVGMGASGVCVAFSMFYLAAPMAVLTLHSYNGEPGEKNQLVNYLAYPAALLCIGVASMFI